MNSFGKRLITIRHGDPYREECIDKIGCPDCKDGTKFCGKNITDQSIKNIIDLGTNLSKNFGEQKGEMLLFSSYSERALTTTKILSISCRNVQLKTSTLLSLSEKGGEAKKAGEELYNYFSDTPDILTIIAITHEHLLPGIRDKLLSKGLKKIGDNFDEGNYCHGYEFTDKSNSLSSLLI